MRHHASNLHQFNQYIHGPHGGLAVVVILIALVAGALVCRRRGW
jgi:hypothetical protein